MRRTHLMRPHTRPFTVARLHALALALVLLLAPLAGLAPSSVAQAAAGDYTTSGPAVTCTYTYTGSEQLFVVPADATNIQATAIGAAGGSNSRGLRGGRGAMVTAALTSVQPGQTLYIEVGGVGTGIGGGF